MDRFDQPDITILTDDKDAAWVAWELVKAAEQDGDKFFEVSQKLERSFTLERIQEVWILVNDGLRTGELLLALYAAFKALAPKQGRRITMRFGARLKIDRDNEERLRALGIDLVFEKAEEHTGTMRSNVERQFQSWAAENVHTIPGLSEPDDFQEEMQRLREQVERDLADLIPEIEEQLGDLDDLIRSTYESIHDPELGFKDSSD
jgi:hypothetical protein